MAQIISGTEVSKNVKERVALEVKALNEKGVSVGLAVILVGEDPASQVYVRNKARACAVCGIESFEYKLPAETSMEELLGLIDELNHNDKVNGILCQLPLPKGLDEKKVIAAIDPQKDVDAFAEVNVGKIMIGNYSFLPCTPAGCMELIKSVGYDLTGKNAVVLGRSNIVGKPMAMLLLQANATVTVCHSKTQNLAEICRNADVIVAAIGKAKFLKADMVKPGAMIIDVGINRMEDGKLCGDVDFEEVEKIASYITPVPGGVGPMTIATLMQNTLNAAKVQNNKG